MKPYGHKISYTTQKKKKNPWHLNTKCLCLSNKLLLVKQPRFDFTRSKSDFRHENV